MCYGETLNFLNCAFHAQFKKIGGGADQTRTDDPLHAMQVLYQLSYNPLPASGLSVFAFGKSAILNFQSLFTRGENWYNPMRKFILYFFLPNVKSFC